MTGRNSGQYPGNDRVCPPKQDAQKRRRVRVSLLFAAPMIFAILFALDALIARDIANMSPLFPAFPARQFSIFVAIVALGLCSLVTYFSWLLLWRVRAVRAEILPARERMR